MEKKDTLSSCSDSEIQQMQLIQDKSKDSCMVSFQRLHSLNPSVLPNNDLKGSLTEEGFKRAFATTLWSRSRDFYWSQCSWNMDQLQKQLDQRRIITEIAESKRQDTSSRSGNDAHIDDAEIRPIYDEEPMAEVQTTAEINIFATGQQHTEQPDQYMKERLTRILKHVMDIRPLPAKLTDDKNN
ncbi:hypothetical protein Tco_0506111 [Tanacetum coccineum]